MAKRIRPPEPTNTVPARFRHLTTRMDRSEWWDPTEPLPAHVDTSTPFGESSWRLTNARRKMLAARDEWLRTLDEKPEGITDATWRVVKRGGEDG